MTADLFARIEDSVTVAELLRILETEREFVRELAQMHGLFNVEPIPHETVEVTQGWLVKLLARPCPCCGKVHADGE